MIKMITLISSFNIIMQSSFYVLINSLLLNLQTNFQKRKTKSVFVYKSLKTLLNANHLNLNIYYDNNDKR